jgi:hypothetical protein
MSTLRLFALFCTIVAARILIFHLQASEDETLLTYAQLRSEMKTALAQARIAADVWWEES